MRQLRRAALAAILLALVASSTTIAAAPAKGFLAPDARPLGRSLTDLATAWARWGFGSAEHNPNIEFRCEPSQLDPRIWFLPVSFGGETENHCDIPSGTFLVMFAGGTECSQAEAEPYHGDDAADLASCVDETLADLTYVEVTADGKPTTNLSAYVAESAAVLLPPGNLFSDDPTLSMTKGYFLVVRPMSPGTHHLSAYDEFDFGFSGAVNYTITVH
jgi:hypothetical protein